MRTLFRKQVGIKALGVQVPLPPQKGIIMACEFCMTAPEQGICVREGCYDCCNCNRIIVPWPECLKVEFRRLGWQQRFRDPYGEYFKEGRNNIILYDVIKKAEEKFKGDIITGHYAIGVAGGIDVGLE